MKKNVLEEMLLSHCAEFITPHRLFGGVIQFYFVYLSFL